MKPPVPSLLVVADSHGDAAALTRIFSWARRRDLYALAFLGDGLQDLAYAMARADFHPNVAAVRGNNDWGADEPDFRTIEFAGQRFLLTHGHRHGISSSCAGVLALAKQEEADAVLHGHTHRMYQEDFRGCFVLCPGSPSRPRGNSPAGFATIDCPPDKWFEPHFWALDGASIKECFLD